jgi:thiamine pyrophosphate-dependent acetolactate synthase large subunit-like protein
MIKALDVFKAFQPYRGKAIVAATGTAGGHWREVSTDPMRDVSLGGAMGQTTSAAFGLALGMPDEKIVLFDAEGALLMNLGVLATIAGKQPKNFVHFLLDNGCYATTGGQPVPNAENIDYAGLAGAAGYASTHSFTELEDFVTQVERILEEEGPIFVAIKIVPEIENLPIGMRTSAPRRGRNETIRDLRRELGIA